MKTISFFVLSLLLVVSLPCNATINYNITFTGSGASITVGDVVVQNLTKGTTVTVPAGNILNISDGLSAVEQLNANDETIHVYPNSVGGVSTLSFFSRQAGNTQINVYSLNGIKVLSISQNLQAGTNSFQLLLPSGSYAIQVVGNKYTYSTKMINQGVALSKPEIVHMVAEKPSSATPQRSKSFASGTTTMAYTTGDRLLYIGNSDNYSTVVTDVPTANKTINFDFIACTDGDGNNYKVVKIGTQTWMAENLKTTKYNEGTSIPNVTVATGWDYLGHPAWSMLDSPGYCWYNNDATTYKNAYGALYNWYTAHTTKLAPVGWHVPSDAEWTILENYLMANAYNYDGTTTDNKYAKSLASTTNWITNSGVGTVGKDLSKNNSTGFSALPCGQRNINGDGTFSGLDSFGGWWCSDEWNPSFDSGAWFRMMGNNSSNVTRGSGLMEDTKVGFSIRCVKD